MVKYLNPSQTCTHSLIAFEDGLCNKATVQGISLQPSQGMARPVPRAWTHICMLQKSRLNAVIESASRHVLSNGETDRQQCAPLAASQELPWTRTENMNVLKHDRKNDKYESHIMYEPCLRSPGRRGWTSRTTASSVNDLVFISGLERQVELHGEAVFAEWQRQYAPQQPACFPTSVSLARAFITPP